MTTRRIFLKQAVVSAIAASTTTAGIQNISAKNIEPNMLDVIDCHTHFYDPSRPQGVPWPRKNTPLYRTVLPKHLRALPKPAPLSGTVIVEASRWVEDNQWLLDLAKDDPFIVGIVGNLQPQSETFAADLKRFAANPLYRGIRVSHKATDQLMAEKDLKPFQLLAEHDLELDINGPPAMLKTASNLSTELPELRIVINHIGNISIDKKGPQVEWINAMKKAASHKNIFCKVSGLVEGAQRANGGKKSPCDVDFYRSYLDVLWDAFGEDRLIYGSNWPVSDRAASYATLQQIVLDYVTQLGPQQTKKFFSLNAQTAYKWLDRKGRNQHIR